MLQLVQRTCAHPGDDEGKLLHTPALAWWIHAVRGDGEFSGLLESGAVVQPLEAYGGDGWAVLETCGLLDPAAVRHLRELCTYDGEHVAFVPFALCTPDAAQDLQLPPKMTPEELTHYNERAARTLAAGRTAVSKEARAALGQGFNANLRPGKGVSVLALMDIQLRPDAFVLGWGWLWAEAG